MRSPIFFFPLGCRTQLTRCAGRTSATHWLHCWSRSVVTGCKMFFIELQSVKVKIVSLKRELRLIQSYSSAVRGLLLADRGPWREAPEASGVQHTNRRLQGGDGYTERSVGRRGQVRSGVHWVSNVQMGNFSFKHSKMNQCFYSIHSVEWRSSVASC